MPPETNTQQVIHQTINGEYRIVIEQAASTKGVLGYKIEANGDDMNLVLSEIQQLQDAVKKICPVPILEK